MKTAYSFAYVQIETINFTFAKQALLCISTAQNVAHAQQ